MEGRKEGEGGGLNVGGRYGGTHCNQSAMHHASVLSRRDSIGRGGEGGDGTVRGEEGGREEVGGGSQPHRAENQPPCGTGQTDRHARRSAVLTIICGGRAVGAGCKSSHDNDDDDDDNSDNNDNNQREVSVKLCKEPHINQVKQVGVPWWPGGPWSQDGKKQAAWTGYWDAADH